MRVVSGVMALIFLLAAGVQWNDPDPWLWIAAYGAAALLAGAHAAAYPLPAALAGGLALTLLCWGAWLSPSLLAADASAFSQIAMQNRIAEEARETLGLWIAAAYCGWLAWRPGLGRRPGRGTA